MYVLDGSLEYSIDRQRPSTYNTGDALMVPAQTIHSMRNERSGNTAELATDVVEKRKPFLVAVQVN